MRTHLCFRNGREQVRDLCCAPLFAELCSAGVFYSGLLHDSGSRSDLALLSGRYFMGGSVTFTIVSVRGTGV